MTVCPGGHAFPVQAASSVLNRELVTSRRVFYPDQAAPQKDLTDRRRSPAEPVFLLTEEPSMREDTPVVAGEDVMNRQPLTVQEAAP